MKKTLIRLLFLLILSIMSIFALSGIVSADNSWEMKIPDGKFLHIKYDCVSKGGVSNRITRQGTAEYIGNNRGFCWSTDQTYYLNITADIANASIYTGKDFVLIDGDITDYLWGKQPNNEEHFKVNIGNPHGTIDAFYEDTPYLGFYVPELELYTASKSKYGDKKVKSSIVTFYTIDYDNKGNVSKISHKLSTYAGNMNRMTYAFL